MGAFYVNYTLRGAVTEDVAAQLSDRAAAVSPTVQGCVVACDELSDSQSMEEISDLAARLSGNLAIPVLAVLNHDDDILWYQLYLNGRLVDTYNSAPGYFEETDDSSGPCGGNAELLCSAFESTNAAKVERILRASNEEAGYVFANQRHADLCDALGIPDFTVGLSFDAIDNGAAPQGMTNSQFVRSK